MQRVTLRIDGMSCGHCVRAWTLDRVEASLRNAGLTPTRLPEPVRQPFMNVPATVLTLDGAELQVYVYGDDGVASRDVAGLDTARVSPPTAMITWRMPASLIARGNLVVIVLTRDEALRRRIAATLVDGDASGA